MSEATNLVTKKKEPSFLFSMLKRAKKSITLKRCTTLGMAVLGGAMVAGGVGMCASACAGAASVFAVAAFCAVAATTAGAGFVVANSGDDMRSIGTMASGCVSIVAAIVVAGGFFMRDAFIVDAGVSLAVSPLGGGLVGVAAERIIEEKSKVFKTTTVALALALGSAFGVYSYAKDLSAAPNLKKEVPAIEHQTSSNERPLAQASRARGLKVAIAPRG